MQSKRGGPTGKKSAATAARALSLATRAQPDAGAKRRAGSAAGGPAFAHAPHAVRIIGGRYKRTPIPVIDAPGLRPTPDRVRETLFNWIAHLRPDIDALRGLDLFAGTGALGFELASRGAAHVTLVEHDRRQLAALHALRDKLGAAQIEIMAGDAFAIAATLPAAGFDLVFLDPPFDRPLLEPALAAVRRLIAPGGLAYAESGAEVPTQSINRLGFDLVRADQAGKVFFCLLRPRDA